MAATGFVKRRTEKVCAWCRNLYQGTRYQRYCGPGCANDAHKKQTDTLTEKRRRRAKQSDKRCGWREGKPSQPGVWLVLDDFGDTSIVTITDDRPNVTGVPPNVWAYFGPIPPPPYGEHRVIQ